jgi:hypothetical protein
VFANVCLQCLVFLSAHSREVLGKWVDLEGHQLSLDVLDPSRSGLAVPRDGLAAASATLLVSA